VKLSRLEKCLVVGSGKGKRRRQLWIAPAGFIATLPLRCTCTASLKLSLRHPAHASTNARYRPL
jgi:hypothetical protein